MNFSKFIMMLLAVYGCYYFIVVMIDLIRSRKVVVNGSNSSAVQYDFDIKTEPRKIVADDDFYNQEAINGIETADDAGEKKNFRGKAKEQTIPFEVTPQEGYKNLGVDLGLEVFAPDGLEVTMENLIALTDQASSEIFKTEHIQVEL